MRAIVIGSVTSTLITIDKLIQHGFELGMVMGYEPSTASSVAGYVNLRFYSESLNIPYFGFLRINDPEVISLARQIRPDVIFAVGFSQLMSSEWFSIPRLGIVGFHPTMLPRGRGRAPMAWLILNKENGAATFFEMNESADAGAIFVQEPFEVSEDDDVESIRLKLLEAMKVALDKWLPELKIGVWNPTPQNDELATYFGVRRPEDGLIDWSMPSDLIDRLIKATTRPYPGAFTFLKGHKMVVWKSIIERNSNYCGVTGRILCKNAKGHLLIQCGKGHLWLTEYEIEGNLEPKVGSKLGISIYDLYILYKGAIEKSES